MFLLSGCNAGKRLSDSSKNKQISVIDVTDYGAIADDDKDDSEAFQRAIDQAIHTRTISEVKIPAGVFDIHKGIVISNPTAGGEYFFVTLKISGHIPSFSDDPRIGSTTVLRGRGVGFTLAIQSSRACLIENITFIGPAIQMEIAEEIIKSEARKWSKNGDLRTNRFSPNCAIAIDPFYKQTQTQDRYPGFEHNYSNISNTGSSMLTIKGCSFHKYYIAIANNPSNGVANGDNIKVEDSYVESCHTFWSAGQTQSRNNVISNVYALFINTFVSGNVIGQQQGTPPNIRNVNIAGFCRTVFNIKTAFSGLGVDQCYFENIWSLGIVLANTVHFSQCQFQFALPSEQYFAPPFQLYSNSIVTFDGCSIEYFDDCNSPVPFLFRSGGLNLVGGFVEGGVVLANGITNEGGESLHNINYLNVRLKCTDSFVNQRTTGVHLKNLENKVIIGGSEITTYDGTVLSNQLPTYDFYKTEKAFITLDEAKNFYFNSSNPNLYRIGDNLLTDHFISLDDEGLQGSRISAVLGFVKKIEGNKIILTGTSQYLSKREIGVYYVGYHKFLPEIEGMVKQGSDMISVRNAEVPLKEGDRIKSPYFDNGTYIVSVHGNNIRASSSAKTSSDGFKIINSNKLLVRN